MKLIEIKKMAKANCLKFGQVLFSVAFIMFQNAQADETLLRVGYLNPFAEIREKRAPSSTVPNDRIFVSPKPIESWTANILVEDDAGVMLSIKNDLQRWQEIEEFRENWSLQESRFYETPDIGAKKAYLSRMLLRYLDKRVTGGVKKAEAGSTLHRVGQVKSALKPNTEAQISKNIKVKFKARLLQGEAIARIENPWVEYHTIINRNGDFNMHASREFASIGVRSYLDYNVNGGVWTATFDKPLTNKLMARLSSAQSDKQMAFEEQTNRTLQFIFTTAF